MRVKKISILWLFTLLLLAACAPFSKNKPDNIHLQIFETTDLHGSIFPFDFIDSAEVSVSLAHIYSLVSSERDQDDREVILLDNGDILQGQPVVYYSNYIDTGNLHICSAVMNFMGYDAATVGNHDIEAGHRVYDKLVEEFNFPWLAANAVNTETNKPYFKPYTIINRKGLKIAVLGLITPAIPQWLPEKLWEGMQFEDMISSAHYWVPEILKKEDPDLLIGLFHAGYDYSYHGSDASTSCNENASLLVAQQVPGFDIVMLGHDHNPLNQFIVNNNGDSVLMLNAGSHARFLALADVHLSFDNETGKYNKKIKGELINVSGITPDEKFDSTFREKFRAVLEYVSTPLGRLENGISAKYAFFGNSAFVDLVHNIQLDLTKADVSFTAPLSFNATLPSGIIRVRDMFKLYRFENFLYTMELTGQEIKDYLEFSYANWFNTMKNKNDHLLKFKTDSTGAPVFSDRYQSYVLDGQYYNFDSGAGLKYTVDVSHPVSNRIIIYSLNDDSEFELSKTYKVAVNSYRGNGGGGHLTLGAGIPGNELNKRVISSTGKDLRFYMMEWIKQQGDVNPVAGDNWNVIPAEWWKEGSERDCRLLFGSKEE
jgi:2',3'-cyclic-nucleotide 2'-phosphodiesterase/3'-nucleotidase